MDNSLAGNPLLETEGLPDYAAILPEHVIPAITHLLNVANTGLATIEEQIEPTWEKTIGALEELDRPFERGWQPVGHLLGVRNSAELRQAYETVLPQIVGYSLRVQQSQPIYSSLMQLRDSEAWESLPPARQRIIEQRIQNSELAGVGLDGEDRARFNRNAEELSQLSTKFSNNVLDATKAFELVLTDPIDVEGMPKSALAAAAHSYSTAHSAGDQPASVESGPWRFTLDHPSFTPFMEHARPRDFRERMYRAFVSRASDGEFDNTEIIDRTLELRREQAELLGYSNYAEISLASKMARSVEEVTSLLTKLRTSSWDAAEKEHNELTNIARETGFVEELMHWDVGFFAERLREQRFAFTDEELRPYFSLDRVLDGLFELCRDLFGITVRPVDGDVPVWNKDVRFYTVHDEANRQVASFYLDPYSRPEDKRGGAWMADCLQRRRLPDGKIQLPVAHLVCNQTPPVGETPSLMSFREVETLFHEFGHGLQHMLTKVDDADASGINGVEWDAVELPSQFMENWCYHEPTLMGITRHYETGEPLPHELFEKICKARTYRAGTQMLRQILFGLTDMTLHSSYDPATDGTPFDVQRRIAEKTSVMPMLPDNKSLCGFAHIFAGGYAAGYYSYKWAEVLSADAFEAFVEVGLDNDDAVRETGKRFRETVLASGGGRHPMEVFREFRGREPSPEPLLKHSGLKA
ncbi:M3 family metallopeptidase [Stratiformator vulcanicus]|uniref:oligopeptidase A n=1 Tax=Stratiformator vulcanicus TaxID=2527980 RepID=A0A517R6L4_9PLAN|nr:M3 family metallopeptidase [Stratiformator vulcanicus]QDT39520.1 Oligopeptidase A [Stratiformator vulcanicus]